MVRTRFAPSPTGFMHIGNLRTALYAYLYARSNGGKFIIRIEDTDQERYVEGAVEVIFNTLRQAGIDYDEGPDKQEGNYSYTQSERKPIYAEYAKLLVSLGGAYHCFCGKRNNTDGSMNKYDKHCLSLSKEEVAARLAAGESYVIRQNILSEEGVSEYEDMVYGSIKVPYKDMEDAILIKSDGMPTYNFANVVDDHLMDITHVIRGNEYLSSTPQYNLLYDSFGWQRPRYIHLPPIMKDKERKLSKRYGDANFDDFVKKGYLPEAVVNYIALLGWSPKDNTEKLTMEQLKTLFNVEGISCSPSIFDEPKLRWLNSEYIHSLTPQEFCDRATPFFDKSKIAGKVDYLFLSSLLIPRVEVFSDIPVLVDFLAEYTDYDLELFAHEKNKITKELAKVVLQSILPALEGVSEWSNENLFAALTVEAEKRAYKKAQVLWCVRIAVTGRVNTPGGATEMAVLLGKEESLSRIKSSIQRL
ncbi:MAG: glutamate--tRNA ligase [Clostridia bacterium]|nr:glutamate--tRNA ligase [Clostridia bacterium]